MILLWAYSFRAAEPRAMQFLLVLREATTPSTAKALNPVTTFSEISEPQPAKDQKFPNPKKDQKFLNPSQLRIRNFQTQKGSEISEPKPAKDQKFPNPKGIRNF